jgi:hypothetical protein
VFAPNGSVARAVDAKPRSTAAAKAIMVAFMVPSPVMDVVHQREHYAAARVPLYLRRAETI